MKKILLVVFIFTCCNGWSQCTWDSFFPFKMGDTKFDVSRIKSQLKSIGDAEDKFGMNDAITKLNNGYRKYKNVNDSVYINVINLRFINNNCFSNSQNRIQLTLSDDKLHKATVEISFNSYESMKQKYEKLLELVPELYNFTAPFVISNSKTNEKIGEGLKFFQKSNEEKNDKPNYINISYKFDYKKVWDDSKKVFLDTNEIENYTLEIQIVDLTQSKLTKEEF